MKKMLACLVSIFCLLGFLFANTSYKPNYYDQEILQKISDEFSCHKYVCVSYEDLKPLRNKLLRYLEGEYTSRTMYVLKYIVTKLEERITQEEKLRSLKVIPLQKLNASAITSLSFYHDLEIIKTYYMLLNNQDFSHATQYKINSNTIEQLKGWYAGSAIGVYGFTIGEDHAYTYTVKVCKSDICESYLVTARIENNRIRTLSSDFIEKMVARETEVSAYHTVGGYAYVRKNGNRSQVYLERGEEIIEVYAIEEEWASVDEIQFDDYGKWLIIKAYGREHSYSTIYNIETRETLKLGGGDMSFVEDHRKFVYCDPGGMSSDPSFQIYEYPRFKRIVDFGHLLHNQGPFFDCLPYNASTHTMSIDTYEEIYMYDFLEEKLYSFSKEQ